MLEFEPQPKKAKVQEEPEVKIIGNEEVMIIKDETQKKVPAGKEAAIEAEVKAARERAVVPLDVRMKQFRELLEDKQISAFSTWEKELHKIVFDPRYLLLTSKERKQVFDKYVRERADEERKEKKAKAKEKKDAFRALCEEKNVTAKTSWSEFSREVTKDERFKSIDKSQDRESLFNEFQSEIRNKERDEKEERRKVVKKDFKALLKETASIDQSSHWSDVKKMIDKDKRYLAVDSSSLKEDWFYNYVQDLKRQGRKRSHSQSPARYGSEKMRDQGWREGGGLGKRSSGKVIPPFVIPRDKSDKRGVGLPVDPELELFHRKAEEADTWMAKQEALLINQV